MILSIDPGKRQVGYSLWALSEGYPLWRAGLVRAKCPYEDDMMICMWTVSAVAAELEALRVNVTEYVAERPRIYPVSKQVKKGGRTDPNDLPPLMGVSVALGFWAQHRALQQGYRFIGKSYYPREWKGTLSKEQMNERAWERLTETERARVQRPEDHNVLDALGIGLKYAGRLEPVRVYPR